MARNQDYSARNPWSYIGGNLHMGNKKYTELQAFDKAKCFGKLYAFKLQGIKQPRNKEEISWLIPMAVTVEARQSHCITRTVGSTSVQQKCRNIHILFCLANAGIMAHTGHGLVNMSCEWQHPNCLLGFTGSWETTGGGSSRHCSGKYWLSEAARQDLATHSRGKWRQAVCPALWMQKFWTREQRNSLQMLDSSPEFRKLEFRYIHCDGYKVSHHSATKCSFCWRQLKTTLSVWVFPVCFFKQDSFKRPYPSDHKVIFSHLLNFSEKPGTNPCWKVSLGKKNTWTFPHEAHSVEDLGTVQALEKAGILSAPPESQYQQNLQLTFDKKSRNWRWVLLPCLLRVRTSV